MQSWQEQWKVLLCLGLLLFALALLFYPYLRVSQLYGAKREWAEIALMLPRGQSYFFSDSPAFLGADFLETFAKYAYAP